MADQLITELTRAVCALDSGPRLAHARSARNILAPIVADELRRLADVLLTAASLDDTAAGREAYAVTQTLLRMRAGELSPHAR